MSDVKCARMLLEAAERDLVAIKVLHRSDEVPDEILGFHIQQAAEKTLKAWIAVLGETYPLSHSIGTLLDFLVDRGADMQPFQTLMGYTPYAVEFRYRGVPSGVAAIDRDEAIQLLEALLGEVHEKLVTAEAE